MKKNKVEKRVNMSPHILKLILLAWAGLYGFNICSAQTMAAKAWKTQAVRIIDLDPADNVEHHLRDIAADSSLFDIIDHEIQAGALNAYDSIGNKLSEIKIYQHPDTQTILDPITNLEKIVVIHHSLNYGHKPRYKIIEDWLFDPVSGNTKVRIRYIVPTLEQNDPDKKTLLYRDIYWLKYEDVAPILGRFEEMHPNSTLSRLLWNEYFMIEVKPHQKIK